MQRRGRPLRASSPEPTASTRSPAAGHARGSTARVRLPRSPGGRLNRAARKRRHRCAQSRLVGVPSSATCRSPAWRMTASSSSARASPRNSTCAGSSKAERKDAPADVQVRSAASTLAGFSIAVLPRARELLQAAGAPGPVGQCVQVLPGRAKTAGGYAPCILTRAGFTGELGYEIWTTPDYFAALYEDRSVGRRPRAGPGPSSAAVPSRACVSKRLTAPSTRISAPTTPRRKPASTGSSTLPSPAFTGRDAALAERARGPARRFVVMAVADADADVVGYESIMKDGAAVGYVTSGAFGHLRGQESRGRLRAECAGARRRALRDRHPGTDAHGDHSPRAALRPARAAPARRSAASASAPWRFKAAMISLSSAASRRHPGGVSAVCCRGNVRIGTALQQQRDRLRMPVQGSDQQGRAARGILQVRGRHARHAAHAGLQGHCFPPRCHSACSRSILARISRSRCCWRPVLHRKLHARAGGIGSQLRRLLRPAAAGGSPRAPRHGRCRASLLMAAGGAAAIRTGRGRAARRVRRQAHLAGARTPGAYGDKCGSSAGLRRHRWRLHHRDGRTLAGDVGRQHQGGGWPAPGCAVGAGGSSGCLRAESCGPNMNTPPGSPAARAPNAVGRRQAWLAALPKL